MRSEIFLPSNSHYWTIPIECNWLLIQASSSGGGGGGGSAANPGGGGGGGSSGMGIRDVWLPVYPGKTLFILIQLGGAGGGVGVAGSDGGNLLMRYDDLAGIQNFLLFLEGGYGGGAGAGANGGVGGASRSVQGYGLTKGHQGRGWQAMRQGGGDGGTGVGGNGFTAGTTIELNSNAPGYGYFQDFCLYGSVNAGAGGAQGGGGGAGGSGLWSKGGFGGAQNAGGGSSRVTDSYGQYRSDYGWGGAGGGGGGRNAAGGDGTGGFMILTPYRERLF